MSRILTDQPIRSFPDLKAAFARLHTESNVSHIVVTSIRLPDASNTSAGAAPALSVVGSSRTSRGEPRAFRIDVVDIDCYFSGTGDMFAALLVARLREAVAHVSGLARCKSWLSDDNVPPTELPLCRAVCKVLASMARILEATKAARDLQLKTFNEPGAAPADAESDLKRHRAATKAAEIRLVRHSRWLLDPGVDLRAVAI